MHKLLQARSGSLRASAEERKAEHLLYDVSFSRTSEEKRARKGPTFTVGQTLYFKSSQRKPVSRLVCGPPLDLRQDDVILVELDKERRVSLDEESSAMLVQRLTKHP